MPRRGATTWETVLEEGQRLPGVEVSTAWGAPALTLHGRMFACGATHKSAEPDTLVVRMDVAARDLLIADDPDTYYLKDHYVGYPCVLVRLGRVDTDALRDLLTTGWRFVSKSGMRRSKGRGARR